MCLNSVALVKKNGRYFGYKNYVKVDGQLNADQARDVKLGKWMKARGGPIHSDGDGPYPAGFHIFLKENDAASYETMGDTYLVEFKDIVAIGNNYTTTDDGEGITVVAKEMKVLRKVQDAIDPVEEETEND